MKKSHARRRRHMRDQVAGNLNVAIFKEGRMYLAFAPALDLVAQGRSMVEARKHFEELFDIYLEETLRRGTLEKDLLRCGWQKHAGELQPPDVTPFPSEKMGPKIELKALAIVPLVGKAVCPA